MVVSKASFDQHAGGSGTSETRRGIDIYCFVFVDELFFPDNEHHPNTRQVTKDDTPDVITFRPAFIQTGC
jgi:hypothetical protein